MKTHSQVNAHMHAHTHTHTHTHTFSSSRICCACSDGTVVLLSRITIEREFERRGTSIAYFRNDSLKNAEVATANYQMSRLLGLAHPFLIPFLLSSPFISLSQKNFLPQSKREASPHSTSKYGKGFMIKDRTSFFSSSHPSFCSFHYILLKSQSA